MNEIAFHPDTQALLEYGRAIAAGLNPPSIKSADGLADRLFVVDGVSEGRSTFLTFGAELMVLFRRDLRRTELRDLFLEPDQKLIQAFLSAVTAANQPGVACAVAESVSGLKLGLEILATPLAKGVLAGERLLGLIQPLGGEGFMAGEKIVRVRLISLHPPLAKAPVQPLRLVVSNA
ncbi:MAG TPA: PAS domain-containing protein [Caulobacterales bacterium]|nr:PAS domain-containing protein [Caulobacterales bacterium]